MDIDNPSTSVVGDNDVIASTGSENANLDNPATTDAINLKDIVKQATGREYENDAAALKGISDTYKYVSQKTAQATPSPSGNEEFEALRQKVEMNDFYSESPDLKEHKDLIETFAKANNMPRQDVIKTDAFKSILGKIKLASEVENSKSILESNPRLGIVRNKIEEAKQNLEAGNMAQAKANAVSAVLESLE